VDVGGALSAWQKLLDTNPNYENKGKLLDLMAQVKKHSGMKPGTQAKALPPITCTKQAPTGWH
jgi:hypothetical protein